MIAFVVNEMKKLEKVTPIPLEQHHETLALLNETVGDSIGSSNKKNLFPRIYRKWKHALPNLGEAPLFKVMGRKKEYDDGLVKTYRFSEEGKDIWANLFEYKGSGENVRLRFSVDKLGVNLNDVVITYEGNPKLENVSSWDRFIENLKTSRKDNPRALDENLISIEPGTEVSRSGKSIWLKMIGRQKMVIIVAASTIVVLAIAVFWRSYSRLTPYFGRSAP